MGHCSHVDCVRIAPSVNHGIAVPHHGERQRLDAFTVCAEYTVEKSRKGKQQTVDIRPLVVALHQSGPDRIELRLLSLSGRPGIKPVEALQAILGLDPATALGLTILKTGWRPAENV